MRGSGLLLSTLGPVVPCARPMPMLFSHTVLPFDAASGAGGRQGRARRLHDGAGRQRISNVAGTGRPTVLAKGLVAAAVSIAAPLHRVGREGLSRQSVQDTGVHRQCGQPIVSEEHSLPLAGGAGDELVLRTGLIEDLQAFLTHGVEAGEDAGPLVGKIVHVATGGAFQGLAWRGRVQHILVDDNLI